jgi:DNA-binding beta-propeller fold protein YncE
MQADVALGQRRALLFTSWLAGAILAVSAAEAQVAPGALAASNAQNSTASVLLFDSSGNGTTILGLAHGLGSPRGLAVQVPGGDLFIADAAVPAVFRWNQSSGLVTFADASDGIGSPQGLAFDGAGNLYLSNANNANASILRFDSAGNGTTILTTADGLGSPRDLAIQAGTGDLFIADAAAQVVWRWNSSSGLSTFADATDGIGNPEGLAFDAAGNLYISNASNATASVRRFDVAGNGTPLLGVSDGLGSPRDLAIQPGPGDLFIADAADQRIFRWSASAGLSTFADAADAVGTPQGLAFAPLPSPLEIPGLGSIGLGVLVLALGAAGYASLRRT